MRSSHLSSHPSKREPLGDATARVNNQLIQATPQKRTIEKPHSSPQLPHHESHYPNGNLASSPPIALADKRFSAVENKYLNTITSDSPVDPHRLSQASQASTNASITSRARKTHIGPWHLGCTLGKGATGRVRKARHAITGQMAAVKIVSRRSAVDARSNSVAHMESVLAKQRPRQNQRTIPYGINREIIIMKVIEHPNIIKVYDVWENRGEMYLVLELVEGGELFDHIIDHGQLEEYEAVRLFRQIISGVAHCHRFLLYHRDIKPENILLDRDMNVKIVDFGMAALQFSDQYLKTACGSPHYAAPEVAEGPQYKGEMADVWSCGIVLYVMLCGVTPFGTNYDISDAENGDINLQAILEEVRYNEPELPPYLSNEAADLIVRMLQKDPGQRIPLANIWRHPLLTQYEPYTRYPKTAPFWIGGPPADIDKGECGPLLTSRDEVDMDIVDNICALTSTTDIEQTVNVILSKRPNLEKVLYQRLLRSRRELEENFQAPGIIVSSSDYHHAKKRPLKRTVTKSSLLVPGPHVRQRSQFSIVESVRRPSVQSRQTASEAETESSYDPFRPSRHRFTSTEAEYAKITLLRGASDMSKPSRIGSNGASAQHPALARIQADLRHSIPSSPMPNPPPVDMEGNIRELRRYGIVRHPSRSSFASSARSRGSSYAYRRSASYKRSVSFNHASRKSSVRETPPPRPRAPSPLNMQQRYIHDCLSSSPDQGYTNIRYTPEPSSSPQLRSRKEGPLTNATSDYALQKAKRLSIRMREEARQVSMELEKACDDAFMSPEKKRTQTQPSMTASQDDTRKAPTNNRLTAGFKGQNGRFDSEALRRRPLPVDPPVDPIEESSASRELRDLESTRESCLQRAEHLPRGLLDEVIRNLDRLISTKESELPEHERKRRVTSAPEARSSANYLLSPVKEEDDAPYNRNFSEPIRKSHGRKDHRGWDGNNSTIRMVNGHDAVPKPLTIKKKPSGTNMKTAQQPELRNKLSTDTALKAKKSFETLGSYRQPVNTTSYSQAKNADGCAYVDSGPSYLDPIEEDEKENRNSRASKRSSKDSKDGKTKGWFKRRSGTSQKSAGSDNGPTPPAKDNFLHPHTKTQFGPQGRFMPPETNTVAHEESEDFVFRPGKKDKAIRTKKSFLSFFKKDPKPNPDLRVLEDDEDDDAESFAPSSIVSREVNSAAMRSYRSVDKVRTTKNVKFDTSHFERGVQSEPQNWLARFLHVKPAVKYLAFKVSKNRAMREVRGIFRDWRRYGMRDITSDKATGRIWARVDAENSLRAKPVSILVELFAVSQASHRGTICVARVSQEQGAKSSFLKVVSTLSGVLRGRDFLFKDKRMVRELRLCLAEWEGTI